VRQHLWYCVHFWTQILLHFFFNFSILFKSEFTWGPLRWFEDWVIRCARRSWENWVLSWREKAQGRFYCYLHLLEVCSDRMKGSGYKLKYRRFRRSRRKYVFMWGWPNISTGCPPRLCSLHPWRCSELSWTSSWATCWN